MAAILTHWIGLEGRHQPLEINSNVNNFHGGIWLVASLVTEVATLALGCGGYIALSSGITHLRNKNPSLLPDENPLSPPAKFSSLEDIFKASVASPLGTLQASAGLLMLSTSIQMYMISLDSIRNARHHLAGSGSAISEVVKRAIPKSIRQFDFSAPSLMGTAKVLGAGVGIGVGIGAVILLAQRSGNLNLKAETSNNPPPSSSDVANQADASKPGSDVANPVIAPKAGWFSWLKKP